MLAEHWIVPLFLLVNLAIGLWAHRYAKVDSFEDYALASRSLPTGVLVMTVLATVLAVGTMSYMTSIYCYGIVGILERLCTLIGFLCAGTFIAPYLGYFDGAITLGDLMNRFYGRFAQIVAGLVGCIACLFMISLQIGAVGALSEYLLDIPYTTAVLCLGGLVVFYSTLGGGDAICKLHGCIARGGCVGSVELACPNGYSQSSGWTGII